MKAKVHQAVRGTASDPDAMRSLCGRSSSLVWNVETIENRQNVTEAADAVTCSFCLRLLRARLAHGATP